MRELSVVCEKRGSTEQYGAISVIHDFWNDPVVERTWIQKDLTAGYQRHDGATGQAKRMEERQSDHKFVERREIGHGTQLCDVGQQGGVRMHNAFRFTLGSGRKQHHGGIVRSLRNCRKVRNPPESEYPKFIQHRHPRLEILQLNSLDATQR